MNPNPYMEFINAFLRFAAFDSQTWVGLDSLYYLPQYFDALIALIFWTFVYVASL